MWGSIVSRNQTCIYRLVSYCSKKLPEAVQRYSISELELTGLLANISIFKHILKHIQDQCFVAATRSRSKEASEKVPDIFPLQGELRKPEHVHKPKKDRILDQPMIRQFRDNLPSIVQLPPPIPYDIDVNQEIGVKQIPVQRPLIVPKEKEAERNRPFQLPKSTPFGVENNMGQTVPNFPQQPV